MGDSPISANKAATLLGLSAATVSRMFHDGIFPNAFEIDGNIRIPLADIDAAKQQPFKREAI